MSKYEILKRILILKHCDSTISDLEGFVREITYMAKEIEDLQRLVADLRESNASMRLQFDNLYRKEMQRVKRRERSQAKVGAV